MRHRLSQLSNCIEELSDTVKTALRAYYDNTQGMIGFDEALLLYCLARDAAIGCIVEIGSYRGRSAVFLGRGSMAGSGISVIAVDPHKSFVGVLGGRFGPNDRTAFYQAMLNSGCSEIVSLINLSSEEFTSSWTKPVSLLWIDGDHSYKGVKRDFECWEPHLDADAMIAFDDAADPELGPRHLIDELTTSDSGRYKELLMIGKVSVIMKNMCATYSGSR